MPTLMIPLHQPDSSEKKSYQPFPNAEAKCQIPPPLDNVPVSRKVHGKLEVIIRVIHRRHATAQVPLFLVGIENGQEVGPLQL